MIIRIRDEEGRKFTIPAPLWLLKLGMSKWVIRIALKHVGKEGKKHIEQIDFNALSKCLGDLKEYRGLKMVDINSKDGTKVEIII